MANKDQRKSIKRNELHSNPGLHTPYYFIRWRFGHLLSRFLYRKRWWCHCEVAQGNWFTRRINVFGTKYVSRRYSGTLGFLMARTPGEKVASFITHLHFISYKSGDMFGRWKCLKRWWALGDEVQVEGTSAILLWKLKLPI